MAHNFIIGQRVVCVHNTGWANPNTGQQEFEGHPKYKEMLKIDLIRGDMLGFEEYPIDVNDGEKPVYWHGVFRPLDHQFAEDLCARLTAEESVIIYV